jgi:hypothetical protein
MIVVEKRKETTPLLTTEDSTALGALMLIVSDEGASRHDVNVDSRNDERSSTSSHSFIHVPTHPPRKPLALRAFHSIELIAIVASLRLAGTQIIPLFLTCIKEIPIINLALRLYISFFCITMCLIELEVPLLPLMIQESLVSQSYLTRGLLYTFLALVAMNDAEFSGQLSIVRDVKSVPWTAIFTELTAWPIYVVGHVYILLGVCCCANKQYRDGLTRTFQQQLKEYREAIGECNSDDDDEKEEELLKP